MSAKPASLVTVVRVQNNPTLAPIHLPGTALNSSPADVNCFPSSLYVKLHLAPALTFTRRYTVAPEILPITFSCSGLPPSAPLQTTYERYNPSSFFVRPTYA